MPLLTFLVAPNPVLALTHVRVPKEPDPVSFMAIDREAIILVAPAFPQELAGSVASSPSVARHVACYLPDGILRGQVEVPVGLRLSDHLRDAGEFLVVRHGMFTPYGETLQSLAARGLQGVVLRRRHAVGVAETS
jgi:hypothetical protein